jgi:hypothetical protein
MSPFAENSYNNLAGVCSECLEPYTIAEVYALTGSATLNLCSGCHKETGYPVLENRLSAR